MENVEAALLAIVFSSDVRFSNVKWSKLPPAVRRAVGDALEEANVSVESSDIDAVRLDASRGRKARRFWGVHVHNADAEVFQGDYVVDGDRVIAKREIASS